METDNLLSRYYALRRTLLDPLAWKLSRRELHQMFKKTTPQEIVRAMFEYTGRGNYASIRAVQIADEIMALAGLVEEKKPRGIVEIGTRKGGSLFIWARVAETAERIISIDLPGGIHGGGYPTIRQRLYREFVADRPHTDMILLRQDSQSEATQQRVGELLGETPLDFLFIDGDHRYKGVRRDFELYEPLVAPAGLIAFHDILPQIHHPECEVDRLWNEIKDNYEHREFVEAPDRSRCGIGVLVKS